MSAAEESPAQRAARLRRERREAKIMAGGSARLDKITSLSGRTPSSMKDDTSRVNSPFNGSTPEPQSEPISRSASPLPAPAPPTTTADQQPENIEAQEAYLRTLLRSKMPPEQPQEEEDPTAKLLSSLMGADTGFQGGPGDGSGAPGQPPVDMMVQNLTSAFGLPPSVGDFFTQQLQPESPEDQRKNGIWRIVHTIVALITGIWVVFKLSVDTRTYGMFPPPPATAQNPFLHFLTAELILGGTRLMTGMGSGQARLIRVLRKVISDSLNDGKIILFMVATAGMWMGTVERNQEKP